MKKLVLFGAGKITEVIHYYAESECGFEVVGFCVDDAFHSGQKFLGKEVVPLSKLASTYSAEDHAVFVAIGYHNLNELRKNKCAELAALGYELTSIVPSSACVPSNVSIGKNCFIMPPSIIHPCVSIGDNVFVWSGAMVGHHSIIENDCWLTSQCSIGGGVQLGSGTFLAMNAVIAHSVKVGKACFLGANTLVTKHMEDGQVVISESSKPIRLNSKQFLRMSSFSSL